ncbi:MAG: glycosyltransferase family 2 protein [Oscillospiraceae bacterium]|nr:glycosyltransferase family 2 protein [Oscillospiraceae bacterium]MDD6145887.1 glycosyltransferase family 2 protein [Oscillospiraceae bacterium]
MNHIMPLISVIIPVYKTQPYLEKCVRSVMEQTYKNLEIILVDDGSPDQCPEICDRLASNDSRIFVIHKKNGGLSDARNCGMAASRGEYLFFIDSDDSITHNAVEILFSKAIETDADIVCGDYLCVNENAEVMNHGLDYTNAEMTFEEAIDYFAMKSWGAWGKLYKKDVHKDILFPTGKIHEDEAIMFDLLSRCRKIALVEDEIYLYLQRENSITSQSYSKKKMDWFFAWMRNTTFIEKKYPSCLPKCLSKTWDTAMYNIDHLIGQDGNTEELETIKAFTQKYRKQILNSPYISMTKKIRLIIFLLSDEKKTDCLYCRFYRAVGRM